MTDNRPGEAPTTTDGSKAAAATDGSTTAAGGRASVSEAGRPADARGEGNRQPPRYAPPQQEGFDWRGWVLVAIVVVSFLLVPGAILVLPYAQSFVESLGLTFRAAYLALPMIPALLLGATAVWAAVRSRRS
jgi:hypothetical protein